MSASIPAKGRELERAVRFIQQTVLAHDPKLNSAPFSVESNKIVNVSGVRHEIDVWVETLPESLYKSLSIFECKDHKKPIDKNVVMNLAKTVDAVSADRGFLVARRLTKDAHSQIKLEKRLRFIPCTSEFASALNNMQLLHVMHELLPIELQLKFRGVPVNDHPVLIDWRKQTCVFKKQEVDLVSFLKPHIDAMVTNDKAPEYRFEGVHSGGCALTMPFEDGEFLMGGSEVEYMSVSVRYFVSVRKRRLLSKFELAGQGRSFSFEPVEDILPDASIKIDIVQLL